MNYFKALSRRAFICAICCSFALLSSTLSHPPVIAQKADPPGQPPQPPQHQPPQSQPQQPAQPMGGVSTGTALVSATRRTVGIVDPKAPKVFEDVTAQTPLAAFRHRSGSAQKDYIVETVSGGCAIFDYDADGRPDIYLPNGSTVEA